MHLRLLRLWLNAAGASWRPALQPQPGALRITLHYNIHYDNGYDGYNRYKLASSSSTSARALRLGRDRFRLGRDRLDVTVIDSDDNQSSWSRSF